MASEPSEEIRAEDIPKNVIFGEGSVIRGRDAFKRFHSQREGALTLGDRSRAIGARFATGPQGRIAVGRDCYLNDCILLSEQEISIGDYVMIGWNTTIAEYHMSNTSSN